MKKIIPLLITVLIAFAFTGCNENDDNERNSEWRKANEDFYKKIENNPEYQVVSLPGAPQWVYYKEIKAAEDTSENNPRPLQGSKVKVLYKGFYYNNTYFDKGTEETGKPATFVVSGLVRGFAIALQNMRVGDKWEIWIPWPLGYGSSNYGNIPGYSTLGFEVELVEVELFP